MRDTARTVRFSKKSPWSVFFRSEMSLICHKITVECRWNQGENFTAKIYKLGPKCCWTILIVGDNTATKIIRVYTYMYLYSYMYSFVLCLFSFVFLLFRTVYFNFRELNMRRQITILKLQFNAHAHRIWLTLTNMTEKIYNIQFCDMIICASTNVNCKNNFETLMNLLFQYTTT